MYTINRKALSSSFYFTLVDLYCPFFLIYKTSKDLFTFYENINIGNENKDLSTILLFYVSSVTTMK